MEPVAFAGLFGVLRFHKLLFLNPGLLTGQVAEVEDASPADFTNFVHLDRIDERGLDGEDSFHSDTAGHFADRESPGVGGSAGELNHGASELLESLLVTFLDSVSHGDGVTGLESRVFCSLLVLEGLVN